jgi:hypothetical protein
MCKPGCTAAEVVPILNVGEMRKTRLAGGLCESRRERLVSEAAAGGGVRQLQRLVPETEAHSIAVVRNVHHGDVIAAGLRPALLAIDVPNGVWRFKVDWPLAIGTSRSGQAD